MPAQVGRAGQYESLHVFAKTTLVTLLDCVVPLPTPSTGGRSNPAASSSRFSVPVGSAVEHAVVHVDAKHAGTRVRLHLAAAKVVGDPAPAPRKLPSQPGSEIRKLEMVSRQRNLRPKSRPAIPSARIPWMGRRSPRATCGTLCSHRLRWPRCSAAPRQGAGRPCHGTTRAWPTAARATQSGGGHCSARCAGVLLSTATRRSGGPKLEEFMAALLLHVMVQEAQGWVKIRAYNNL